MIYFPFATYLKSIFSHLHLTKPTPSHYLHTHFHTYAYHHPYLHLLIPRSPTPLTTLLTIYTYFSLYPSSFIIPIFMHTSPIFILPPNSLLLFYTPMCTSNFTPHLPMATSTTLVMSPNLLSPLSSCPLLVPNTPPATSFISYIPIISISLLSNTLRPPFISRSPIPCPPMCMQFMHTIPHYPPQAFSCNVQPAHACSLP